MFDIPSVSAKERKLASRFRNALLNCGFSMFQYSVYFRFLPSKEAALPYKKKLIPLIPDGGKIQFLMISDKQFGSIQTYFRSKKMPPNNAPDQLLLS